MEIWKDIKGYEGIYKISSLGRVKSLQRIVENYGFQKKALLKERILKPSMDRYYYMVRLRKNGESKQFKIHRLLALHFIDNPDSKPHINHIDGNKKNNSLSNLEWCTASENMQHAYDNGLKKKMYGRNNGASKLVLNLESGIYYESCKNASIAYGIKHTTLKSQLNGNNRNKTNLIYA